MSRNDLRGSHQESTAQKAKCGKILHEQLGAEILADALGPMAFGSPGSRVQRHGFHGATPRARYSFNDLFFQLGRIFSEKPCCRHPSKVFSLAVVAGDTVLVTCRGTGAYLGKRADAFISEYSCSLR